MDPGSGCNDFHSLRRLSQFQADWGHGGGLGYVDLEIGEPREPKGLRLDLYGIEPGREIGDNVAARGVGLRARSETGRLIHGPNLGSGYRGAGSVDNDSGESAGTALGRQSERQQARQE